MEGIGPTYSYVLETYFFRARCTSLNFRSFLLAFFICFFVLFQSRRSNAQVFGRTLVHEFHISIAIQNATCCVRSAKTAVSSIYGFSIQLNFILILTSKRNLYTQCKGNASFACSFLQNLSSLASFSFLRLLSQVLS